MGRRHCWFNSAEPIYNDMIRSPCALFGSTTVLPCNQQQNSWNSIVKFLVAPKATAEQRKTIRLDWWLTVGMIGHNWFLCLPPVGALRSICAIPCSLRRQRTHTHITHMYNTFMCHSQPTGTTRDEEHCGKTPASLLSSVCLAGDRGHTTHRLTQHFGRSLARWLALCCVLSEWSSGDDGRRASLVALSPSVGICKCR